MVITKLNKNEATKLEGLAISLEKQDAFSEDLFQLTFGVSKKQAKNNIALSIRTFVEEHR